MAIQMRPRSCLKRENASGANALLMAGAFQCHVALRGQLDSNLVGPGFLGGFPISSVCFRGHASTGGYQETLTLLLGSQVPSLRNQTQAPFSWDLVEWWPTDEPVPKSIES